MIAPISATVFFLCFLSRFQASSCREDGSEELEGPFPVEVDDERRAPQGAGESEAKQAK